MSTSEGTRVVSRVVTAVERSYPRHILRGHLSPLINDFEVDTIVVVICDCQIEIINP
jgi:hypothetical protein